MQALTVRIPAGTLYPLTSLRRKKKALPKTNKSCGLITMAVLALFLWSFAGSDQLQTEALAVDETMLVHPFSGLVSRSVQFVGGFYPLEQKGTVKHLNTFTVKVKNRECLFSIEKAVDLFGDLDQSEVLENIWPANMTFVGADNVIDSLCKSEVSGKKFAVVGTLHFSQRLLSVRSVTEVIPKKRAKGND